MGDVNYCVNHKVLILLNNSSVNEGEGVIWQKNSLLIFFAPVDSD